MIAAVFFLIINLELQSSLKGESVDAILNVAGGWAGGSAADKGKLQITLMLEYNMYFYLKDFIKNSDLMLKQSVYSSLISASLANKFLKENGLLTLAGAAAALDSTPGLTKHRMPVIYFLYLGMIGYGAAKAATIHIGRSLAAPNSGMPANSSVLTIAPYVFYVDLMSQI